MTSFDSYSKGEIDLLLDSYNSLLPLELDRLVDTAIRATADETGDLIVLGQLFLCLEQRHGIIPLLIRHGKTRIMNCVAGITTSSEGKYD